MTKPTPSFVDRLTPKQIERFWGYVQKTDDCWLWVGVTTDGGYGRFKANDVRTVAHRIAYEMEIGPIPEGLQLDHLCRVRACVNPSHLEPVTARENLWRGDTVAARRARRTHCDKGHEFTPENTYYPPSGPRRRRCRACVRAWQEKWLRRATA